MNVKVKMLKNETTEAEKRISWIGSETIEDDPESIERHFPWLTWNSMIDVSEYQICLLLTLFCSSNEITLVLSVVS